MKGIGAEFLSEPDLTTADKRAWNSGFPPGFTVDELRFHRRKKAPKDSQPQDHIQLESGNFENVKTEYKRRFRDYYSANTRNSLHYDVKDLSPSRTHIPDDHLIFDDDDELHEYRPEYHESFIEFPMEPESLNTYRRYKRQLEDPMALFDDNLRLLANNQSENQSQFVKYENVDRRTPIRRSTSLKLEGDFSATTEKAEQFIEYLLAKRRSLKRNPTHLRMEGIMEKKTENREQYVPYEVHSRPPLYKKLTNLRLEGDMDTTTENTDQFVPYELELRPPLYKRNTNLRLEGDLELNPSEYRQEYIEYKSERSSPSLPRHNLKINGFFDAVTENQSKFVDHQAHPPIPFLRGSAFNRKLLLGDDKAVKNAEYREQYIPHNIERSMAFRRAENLSMEGDVSSMTESRHEFGEKPAVRTEMRKAASNLRLQGQIDLNPEYKNAYVDFYKTSNFSSPARRHGTDATHLRSEGSMKIYPEYKQSFVDFPRHRPSVKKPETHLSSEGEMDHMTEKRAQYIEYPRYHKMDAMKHEPEFKLEGDYVCQPEYRRAYIDYLIRERVDRKSRPLDNLTGSAQPQKRAFEVLTPKETTATDVNKNDTTPSTITTTATTSSESKVVKSMIPVSTKKPPSLTPTLTMTDETSDKNVYSSSSTSSRIPRRRPSISKLETQLFGPKIEMPKTFRSSSSSRLTSRSPSPLPRSARTRSLSRNIKPKQSSSQYEETHRDRTGSRFGNFVRVEDLAYTPATSPIPTHKLYNYSPRKKWSQPARDINEQVDRMTAFMVLDDDLNNNMNSFVNRNQVKPLYKEQKWMSSWNSSTT